MKYSNINIDRAPLTEADFAQGKDFSRLMKAYNAPTSVTSATSRQQSSWFKWGLATVITASVITGLLVSGVLKDEVVAVNEVPPTDLPKIIDERPLIAPPILEAEQEYEIVEVDADLGGTLEVGSSIIKVPPLVFVDEEGETVHGTVELKYREYKDKVDLLFSGIPMDYDSAGTTMIFETGGMFELRGEQLGSEIFIAKDQFIDVQMEGNNAPGFNTYVLNEKDKKWDYIEPSAIIESLPQITDADTLSPPTRSPLVVDPNATTIVAYGPTLTTGDAVAEILILEEEAPKALIPLIQPKQANPTRQQVVLSFTPSLFPELATYTDMLFEVDESAGEFDASKTDESWSNVEIEAEATQGSYRLKFTRPGEEYTVPCYPVFAPDDMEDAQSKYSEYLKEREQQAKLRRQKAAENVRLQQERSQAASQRQAQMIQSRNDAQASVQTSSKVSRVFQVRNFGIWNCDRPIRYPNQEIIVSKYQDRNGKSIEVSNVYLADMKRESLISYWGGQSIQFDPKSDNMLWCITNGNQLAVASTEDLKSACKKGECVVQMTVHPQRIQHASDARAILNKY